MTGCTPSPLFFPSCSHKRDQKWVSRRWEWRGVGEPQNAEGPVLRAEDTDAHFYVSRVSVYTGAEMTRHQHPRKYSQGTPRFSPNGRVADDSQNGLISDVWDQLRICLFKSNFKY